MKDGGLGDLLDLKRGDGAGHPRSAFDEAAGEINDTHLSEAGVRAAGDAGVVEDRAEDVFAVAAAAVSVIHDEGDHDAAGVALAIIDIFPGETGPLAKARHAIPRHRAAGSDVSPPTGWPEIEHVGQGAAADALRKNEGREWTRLFKEMDGLTNGGFAFDALVSRHAGGDDLGVLLRGGAGEVEFVANLGDQVGSVGENGEKYREGGDSYKFHKFCQSTGSAKAGRDFYKSGSDLKKRAIFSLAEPRIGN